MPAPIVVFAYNRPDHLRQTLDALARNAGAGQSHLIVFCDGAKRAEDQPRIEAARETAKAARGFKELSVVERPANWGLARSVITGATETISTYGRIIAVEDDLITSPLFLTFMNAALDHYRDDPAAFSLTGHSYPAGYFHVPPDYPYDTYASFRASSWTWATWKDRWDRIDWGMDYFPAMAASAEEKARFNRGGQDMFSLLEMQKDGKIDSWAIRFAHAQHAFGMNCIYPTRTLARNIGMDLSGVHCQPEPRFHNETVDEQWLPTRFCPADLHDESIDASFRALFDPPPPVGTATIWGRLRALLGR